MAAPFQQVPITINVNTGEIVDATSLEHLAGQNASRFMAGSVIILCASCVDSTNTAVAYNTDDTFELSIDNDFVHVLGTGVLEAGLSGTITSLTASGFEVTPDPEGTLTLTNQAGETESVWYTSYTLLNGVYTFVIESTALTYVYLTSDAIEFDDPLMVYSPNSSFNVAGDWDDASYLMGKMSIRVFCNRDAFFDKLGTSDTISAFIEILKYASGSPYSTKLLRDDTYCENTVKRYEGAPAPYNPLFYTAAQVDALLAEYQKLILIGRVNSTEYVIDVDDTTPASPEIGLATP